MAVAAPTLAGDSSLVTHGNSLQELMDVGNCAKHVTEAWTKPHRRQARVASELVWVAPVCRKIVLSCRSQASSRGECGGNGTSSHVVADGVQGHT
ncbi:hypothetical protein IF1G_04437 [Cordyceps javanica]|uniref:Uncharacterized protein n=1 Tax=Cordyceps javanica TaxID=43265 RepID=A0A545V653_9HYPO|nr:hypothetical protein IF1G_04437 [Cordyceps javanica]